MSEYVESSGSPGYRRHQPLKDGDTRDRRGRWSGKVVTVRKQHYEAIEAWQKASGMKKAEFWRQAILRGALQIAQGMGIADKYPDLPDDANPVKPIEPKPLKKRKFPFWNSE